MKKLFFAGMVVALAGCVQVDRYEDVVKAPAPAGLAGFWQTKGPQSAMMSPVRHCQPDCHQRRGHLRLPPVAARDCAAGETDES